MPLAQKDMPARLTQRCCLVCGYDGPELQGESVRERWRCPACDADLYIRPPRSYAELEGFYDEQGAPIAFIEVKTRRSLRGLLRQLASRIAAKAGRRRG